MKALIKQMIEQSGVKKAPFLYRGFVYTEADLYKVAELAAREWAREQIGMRPEWAPPSAIDELQQHIAELESQKAEPIIYALFNEHSRVLSWSYAPLSYYIPLYTAPPTVQAAVQAAYVKAAETCDRFQERDVGMQPAECAGAIRTLSGTDALREILTEVSRATINAVALAIVDKQVSGNGINDAVIIKEVVDRVIKGE